MGIKTKFNPMGGRSGSNEPDLGNLSLWRYSNDVIAGKTLLYNYTGEWYNTENTQMQLSAFYSSGSFFPRNCAYLPSGTTVAEDLQLYTNNGQQTNVKILGVVNTNAFQAGRYPNDYGSTTTVYARNASIAGTFDVIANVPVANYNDPITLYVPKAKGKAIINDWYRTTDIDRNTPFCDNQAVVSVDFQGVDFRNNSMFNAFFRCTNLVSVVNISKNVINMAKTFAYCSSFNQNVQMPNFVTNMFETFNSCFNLNQNIQIPNTVLNMSNAFSGCYNLNQNIKIPDSVTDVANAFSGCNNLNQNIQIPNSVTTMSRTFQLCSNLNQNIRIPDSVTNILRTFINCHSLNQNIQIPSSVTEMVYTFSGCYNLNQNIRIPDSVTNMYSTFYNCRNLEATINILSPILADATLCFGGTNPLKLKRIFIPYKWSNGTYTATFNTFKSAGYIYANEVSTGQHNTIFNDIGIL